LTKDSATLNYATAASDKKKEERKKEEEMYCNELP
jgi:hypothetical protein